MTRNAGHNGGSAPCPVAGCNKRRSFKEPVCAYHLEHPVERTMVAPPKVRGAHVIASVKYTHGGRSDDAPLDCSCGWSGRVGDFQPHRKSVGARILSFSQNANFHREYS